MNWKKTKCCGTCRYWDIDAARNAAGAVRPDIYASCRVPVVLPASVLGLGVTLRAMPRNLGGNCRLYEPRKEVRRYA